MKTYTIKHNNEVKDDIIVEVSEHKTQSEKSQYSLRQLKENLASYEEQQTQVGELITSTQQLIKDIDTELKKK